MHKLAAILILLLGFSQTALGYDPNDVTLKADQLPEQLTNAGIKENLGENLNLDLKFTDENGNKVSLGKYFSKGKPVILSLVYYSCPNLCNFHLNGLNDAMRKLKWTVGEQFDVVAVSFDPREKPEVAKAKKAAYLKAYGRRQAENGWHFLTGSKENVNQLAKSVGFSFEWDKRSEEWAHSSAAILVTPEGKVSRYLHGVHFEPKDLRLALLETAKGEIGNIIDGIILYCFRFDPKKNKYTLYAYNVMKAGATATVFIMMLLLIPAWIRERNRPEK